MTDGGAVGSAAPHVRGRYLSLDLFRGITVAGMLLVNTPGSWGAIYAPLKHAPWHGWTAADLIFPFFLFVVGVTTYISLNAARGRGDSSRAITLRILRRGAIIVLLGLLVSSFPWYPLDRFTGMRIPGVLQRIGVAYTLAALITQRGGVRTQIAALMVILLGYWYVMTGIPVPGSEAGVGPLDAPASTMAAYIDRLLLQGHLWPVTVTWDPEGVLSTLPAVGSVLLGSLLAPLFYGSARRPQDSEPPSVLRSPLVMTVLAGILLAAAGALWGEVFPINKNIWTSSYVLFTGGAAALVLGGCVAMVEVAGAKRWTFPFVVFGRNPLVAFVGSLLMARIMYSLVIVTYDGRSVSLQSAIYQSAFLSWLDPKNASLLFAVAFLLLWLGVLLLLERRNIVIKV